MIRVLHSLGCTDSLCKIWNFVVCVVKLQYTSDFRGMFFDQYSLWVRTQGYKVGKFTAVSAGHSANVVVQHSDILTVIVVALFCIC